MSALPTEPLLNAQQLAETLGVSDSSIYEWAKAGTIPSIRIAGTVRFLLSEVLSSGRQAVGDRSTQEQLHDNPKEERRVVRRLPIHRPSERRVETLEAYDWSKHDKKVGRGPRT